MIKTIGLFFAAALLLSSCAVTQKTASTAQIPAESHAASVATLKVGERVKVEMDVTKPIRKGGWENIRQAVETKALEAAGGADVLLEPRYVVEKHKGLFRSKITKVTVSGRPAVYTDFHALPDSVWCNRIYRAGYEDMITRDGGQPKEYKSKIKDVAPKSFSNSKEEINESDDFERYLGNQPYRKKVRKKGFSTHGSFGIGGLNIHTKMEANNWSDEYGGGKGCALSGMLGAGYNFNPHWYAGLGVSLYGTTGGENHLNAPLFAEGRYYLFKRNISPFASFRLGAVIPKHCNITGVSPLVGASIGYQIGHFEVAFDYTYAEFDFEDNSGNIDILNDFHWWGFRLGYHF